MATDYVHTALEDFPNNSTTARHLNFVGDEFVDGIPRLLSSQVLISLSRLEPLISIGHIALEWSMVFAAMAISERFPICCNGLHSAPASGPATHVR